MNDQLKAASERWINEGKAYKTAINKWLDTIYIDKKQPETDCPEETRKDMAEYVISQLVEFNQQGKHKEFRELFPADNDPLGEILNNDSRWYKIRKVAMLDDRRILVKLGDYYDWQGVYVIKGDEINHIEGLIGFGFCKNKKYFAKVYENHIDIHEGWDSPVLYSFSFPDGVTAQEIQFDSVEVFSTGKQVLLISHRGIFLIGENSCELIHGRLAGEDEEEEEDEDVDSEEDNEDEPARPASVPAEARWNASENEWEIGKSNSNGKPVGEWKWWLAPKGYLCCHTIYEGEDGEVMSFTRYHEDGTPSRIGKYVEGQPFGDITWIKSDKPTIEQYPPNAGANVWKTVSSVKNGYTVEEHYYDKNGVEVQEPYISNTEMSELMKKMGVADRFYIEKNWKHLLAAAEELLDSGVAEDDDQDQMKAVFYKAYAQYELNNKENISDLEDLADTILDLDTFTIWPYLSEFNITRTALRFAHYIKAQIAVGNEDYDEAWDEMNEILNINSPIDDEDQTPYHKLKQSLIAITGDRTEKKSEEGCNKSDGKYAFLDYPHAAISPDDKYIAVGSYESSHKILKKEDGQWKKTAEIGPRSSYPNIACFNYILNEPVVALGSCHFSQSGTLGVPMNQIEGLEASGWDMDHDSLFVIDDKKWVFSMLPSAHGFFLGANDGYIWRKIIYNKSDYLYIGGTVMSIDVSPDKKHLVVGTHTGQVVVLEWETVKTEEGKSMRIDPYLITNLPVIDKTRYVFMAGADPMIW